MEISSNLVAFSEYMNFIKYKHRWTKSNFIHLNRTATSTLDVLKIHEKSARQNCKMHNIYVLTRVYQVSNIRIYVSKLFFGNYIPFSLDVK